MPYPESAVWTQKGPLSILIVGAGSAVMLVFAVACFFALRIFMAMQQRTAMTIPPALTRPGVTQGTGTLDKSVFLTDPALGSVTDMILKLDSSAQLGVAGTRGAVWKYAAAEQAANDKPAGE